MKREAFIVTLLMLVAASLGCVDTFAQTKPSRAERLAMAQEQVEKRVSERDFELKIDNGIGMKGRGVALTNNTLRIKGDSVYSHLQYFGVAHSLPYGGGEGLMFNGVMDEYKSEMVSHKRRSDRKWWQISFSVRTSEDRYMFYIDVALNGSVTVRANPMNKSGMTFSGEMVLDQ